MKAGCSLTVKLFGCVDARLDEVHGEKNYKQMYGKLEKLTERLLAKLHPSIEKATTQQHTDQPTAVSEYFTLPAHSLDNIELVPLKLVTSKRDAIRKAREARARPLNLPG